MVSWQSIPLWDDDAWDGDNGPDHDSAPGLVADDPPGVGALGVFDLETTGIDVREDRIVTAHVGVLDAGGRVVSARNWLADPGVEIPAGATAVHGITTDHARAAGRSAAEVVAEVTAALRELFDRGIPVVAYNAPFDFSMLKYEALRHSVEPIAAPSPVIDPLVVDKTYDRYRRGKRTLEVVAAHYAVRLEGAHDAAADAVAAGRVAQAIAARYGLELGSLELHTQQVSWARAQAESLTEYFISIGRLDPEDALDGSWPIR
ncbi:exonuclease domain-containing protein [Microbacterium sp. CnD16-F]|uniref:exonuclease domain-containing protein n=1 Tax=Microbacterium sp. CnD16-F TaxID=2954493 RepID=UPI002096EEE4|nr:exonuclease domain-containing protein [Microbacterium sp. CnD16-F]MCO7204573.1 exonuclease domain-containing protein [Microbacterium sp. CnD16-F]